jgi:hypothetical protein
MRGQTCTAGRPSGSARAHVRLGQLRFGQLRFGQAGLVARLLVARLLVAGLLVAGLLVAGLLAPPLIGQAPEVTITHEDTRDGAAAVSSRNREGDLHVLMVVGLGGEPRFRTMFHEWATTILDAATDRFDVPAERQIYLGERIDLDPERIQATSTRENVRDAIETLAATSRAGDRVLVILIGHGTGQGADARLNLPGPDPSAADWAEKLTALEGRRLAVVNTASASGDFIPQLTGPDRVIVTATRSGRELNETVFGRYFADAFRSPEADLDKDGDVSLLEAFEYARQEVARFYREENRIQTEFALLDDDGDGVGSRAPGVDGADGERASQFRFGNAQSQARAGAGGGAVNPALVPLLERRRAIEDQISALRAIRETLPESEYERRLEDLLVELALVAREIRAVGGGAP